MEENVIEKRRELLKIVDSLPEEEFEKVKLIVSGYVACYESMLKPKNQIDECQCL